MNIKAVSRYVGLALLVSALFMFLSVGVSLIDGMDDGFAPLLISGIITLIVGSFPFIFVRKVPAISLHDGYLIIVASWMLSFIFGMLPYVMYGGEFSVVNAWFESVSGYTASGATILKDIEALPRSILFFRSATHLIGGLGVVVFLLLVIPEASPFRLKLTNLELSSLSREGYRYRSSRTVHIIVSVFFGLMLAETIALVIAGMPFFDAVNHAFSTVATGGFSIKNESIGYYHSNAIYIIIMVFMTLSAMHFGIIFSVFATRSLKPLRHPVARYFLCCIVVLGLLMSFSLKFQGSYDTWGHALMDGFFHTISYITTTGFAIADTSGIPVLAAAVLMLAGFQCACSGSTTGGLKADRIYLTFKAVRRQIKKNLHPTQVSQVEVGGTFLRDETVLPVMTYIVLYILIIVVSMMLLVIIGVDTTEAFSGALASVGNVGPGLKSIGTAGNYSMQPVLAKVVYTLDMILGRLEIYPVFVAVSLIFKRNR